MDSAVRKAIKRLRSEDLDLSPSDLLVRAVLSANASKAGKARAAKLSPKRRKEIAKKASQAAARRRKAGRHV
jgi:hypothetical protein